MSDHKEPILIHGVLFENSRAAANGFERLPFNIITDVDEEMLSVPVDIAVPGLAAKLMSLYAQIWTENPPKLNRVMKVFYRGHSLFSIFLGMEKDKAVVEKAYHAGTLREWLHEIDEKRAEESGSPIRNLDGSIANPKD